MNSLAFSQNKQVKINFLHLKREIALHYVLKSLVLSFIARENKVGLLGFKKSCLFTNKRVVYSLQGGSGQVVGMLGVYKLSSLNPYQLLDCLGHC